MRRKTVPNPLRQDQSGFTLPELSIAMAIMGILAVIAIPTWWGVVEGRKVDSATNQVASDLRLAHTSATNRLVDAQIRFDSGGVPIGCDGHAVAADYCLIQGAAETPRSFEGDVVLNSPNLLPAGGVSAVEFSPDGSAAAIGTLGTVPGIIDNCPASTPAGQRLQVTVDGSPAHCITFNRETSRVRID